MKAYGNLLAVVTKVTSDRGDTISIVRPVMSWNEDLLDVDQRTHDNWVVSFKTQPNWSLSYGRAQTCRNQSNVWKSQRVLHAYFCPGEPHQRSPNAPKFEDRSHEETEWPEQGASRSSVKVGQKNVLNSRIKEEQHSPHLRKIGVCLHQLLNPRNENLLSTPARRCIWSAKRTWMMLKWILWRNVQSYDSHHLQWLSADAWRGNSVRERIGHS